MPNKQDKEKGFSACVWIPASLYPLYKKVQEATGFDNNDSAFIRYCIISKLEDFGVLTEEIRKAVIIVNKD